MLSITQHCVLYNWYKSFKIRICIRKKTLHFKTISYKSLNSLFHVTTEYSIRVATLFKKRNSEGIRLLHWIIQFNMQILFRIFDILNILLLLLLDVTNSEESISTDLYMYIIHTATHSSDILPIIGCNFCIFFPKFAKRFPSCLFYLINPIRGNGIHYILPYFNQDLHREF